jgi:hypothetical protein
VRPATAPVSVEVLVQDNGSRAFRRIRTVTTNARGSFTLTTPYRKNRRYRLRWNAEQGYPVRAYAPRR